MGTVYLAKDRELRREVAVKLAHRPHDAEVLDRFRREARSMAVIEHPGVARVLDFGEADDQLYLIMEYVTGDRPGLLSPGALTPMLSVAEALEAVHEAGVLHRDVKPSNLIQREDGSLVLIDFGLARRLDASKLTATGEVVGTPYYLAPEILLGEPPSPASDFYSWGATLYVLLEGHPPIPGEKIAGWALHGEHELTWAHTPTGSPERRLVKHCLAHDPHRRPTSRGQLEALRASGTVSAQAPTRSLPAPPLPPPRTASPAAPRAASPEEGPTKKPRSRGLSSLLGVLSLAALVGYALGLPGPPAQGPRTEAPRAAPAAAPLPQAEDLARANADLSRAFGWAGVEAPRDPSWITSATAYASLPSLGDVRLASKLRRSAAMTRAWTRAVAAEGPGAWRAPGRAERFRREVVGGLIYALGLHRVSRNLLENDDLFAFQFGAIGSVMEAAQSRMAETRAVSDQIASELATLPTGEARLVFEGFGAGITEKPPRPHLVADLVKAIAAEPPSPLRSSLASALDFLDLHLVGVARLSCPDRVRSMELRRTLFQRAPGGFSPREHWRRRMRAMSLEVRLDRACQPPGAAERQDHFSSCLDAVEARGAEFPQLTGTALSETHRAILRPHLFYDPPSPWLRAAAPRVQALAARFPAPPEERVPGG